MKFRHKPLQNHYKWHKWFAWYPIRLNNSEIIWLETVIRKVNPYFENEDRPHHIGRLHNLLFHSRWEYKESVLDLLKDKK
jgi:hypothetical protein